MQRKPAIHFRATVIPLAPQTRRGWIADQVRDDGSGAGRADPGLTKPYAACCVSAP